MGFNFPLADFLIKKAIFSNENKTKNFTILEIGALKNSMSLKQKIHLSKKYCIPRHVFEMQTPEIYRYFGFKTVITLDNSSFEGANLLKNLNERPSQNDSAYKDQFDLVIDGGSSEHIYNPIVALANYFNFLKVGGKLIQFLPVNNYIDHGIYQFSPTFFWSIDTVGIKLLDLHIRVHSSKPTEYHWDANSKIFRSHLDGLWNGSAISNLFRFVSSDVIAIVNWEKQGKINYEDLIINSQQEVYKKMWNIEESQSKSEISAIMSRALKYCFKNESNLFGKLIGKYCLTLSRSHD